MDFWRIFENVAFCHILRTNILGVSGASRGLPKRTTTHWKGLWNENTAFFEILQFWRQKIFLARNSKIGILPMLKELAQNWCIGFSGA